MWKQHVAHKNHESNQPSNVFGHHIWIVATGLDHAIFYNIYGFIFQFVFSFAYSIFMCFVCQFFVHFGGHEQYDGCPLHLHVIDRGGVFFCQNSFCKADPWGRIIQELKLENAKEERIIGKKFELLLEGAVLLLSDSEYGWVFSSVLLRYIESWCLHYLIRSNWKWIPTCVLLFMRF